jgi:hypothetical protein
MQNHPEFTRLLINGRPHWRHIDSGRTFPVIAGGDGDGGLTGDADAGDALDPDDTGTGDEDGEKKPPPDPAKEAEKWKAMARKHEAAAKANAEAAKQLKELQDAGKSEEEKRASMIAELQAKERAATIRALKAEVASRLELDAGLTKFLPDVTDEVDMEQAAAELLAATGSADKGDRRRQGTPKSTLTNPLSDDSDPDAQKEQLLKSMLGRAV